MPDNHYLRVRPIRMIDGPLPTPAAARDDGSLAGTQEPERAAAPIVSLPGRAASVESRTEADRPGGDDPWRVVDVPREQPGMFVSWPEACVVLVPLAILVVAMCWLLLTGGWRL